MRKAVALKMIFRSPIKTLLSFLLIAASSFALLSSVTEHVITTREKENAKGFYHAIASLDNEVPGIPMVIANVASPDRQNWRCMIPCIRWRTSPG